MKNLILMLVISFFSQVSLGASRSSRPSLPEEPSLGSLLEDFDRSKYCGDVRGAREALFVKFVKFIQTNWRYGSQGIDWPQSELLALKGFIATDCGPISCCFIALLRAAGLLSHQEDFHFLHCLDAQKHGGSESRIYISKQLFDTRYENNRLLDAPDEFGNIYRVHYLVLVEGVYYDPTFQSIFSSLDALDAVFIHPHDDPSLLVGTKVGAKQKIIIKRLGLGKFQWQELTLEQQH